MNRRVAIGFAAAGLLLATTLAAFAQGVGGMGAPATSLEAKPAVLPLASGLDGPAASATLPRIALGPMDVTSLVAEDQARAATGDKSLRLGVPREQRIALSDGRWDPLPGRGWLWRVEVESKNATAVRVHLTGMNMPEGALIQMYPAGKTAPLFGPFTGRGPVGDGDLWAPPVPGDRMVIEYLLPGDTEAPAPTARWVLVDLVMHDYRGPFDVGDNGALEGTCHNDVTCYSAWANESHGVARIDYVDGGSFLCTGQLLNSLAGDGTPYFLTANHCISNNPAAASATIYWDFQTSTCNGTPPSLGSVPTSSVCTLLSNNATSDYSLLMVEGTLPGGRWWEGWDAGVPANGTFVTGIHHPTGAYKRISFATKQNSGVANHINAAWYSGVTEPGSSGSGLFRDDNHRLVGQLHGGPSYCGAPPASLNDDYGAFSVSYPNISGFMAGGSDDGFEPDDACASPAFIGSGSWGGLIVKSVSSDWYNVYVPANQRIRVNISFTHAYGDIDMQMFDGCGALLGSSTGTGDGESIDYFNTGAAKNVRIHVYLFSDTRNAYGMSVAVENFPNLNANIIPSGFTFPEVPRNTNDAGFFNAPLPATLNSNALGVYQNWSVQSEGPGPLAQSWEARLYIDETWAWQFGRGPGDGVVSLQALNLGPDFIRGGRHGITSYADYGNTAVESNEGDNVWYGQYVFSPLLTSPGVGLSRIPPPDRGVFSIPNGDGFRDDRPSNYAWVTAVAPTQVGDDYDLYVYDDYSGSLSGFSNLRKVSAYGGTFTDFVVGNYSGTPTTIYPQAIRFAMNVGGTLLVDQHNAAGRNASGNYSLWAGQVLDAGRLTDVYEAYMVSGTVYRMTLHRSVGTADIAFGVYPGTAGGIYARSETEATSSYAGDDLDTLRFTAATTGWHPVVVYRNTGTDVSAVRYDFAWGDHQLVGVDPPAGAPMALDFLGAMPNPVSRSTRLGFTLPSEARVSLAIYDVTGRRLKSLAAGSYGAGRHDIPWDGRGDAGQPLGAGIYWARFESGGRTIAKRVIVTP